jgi:hypothetical protein
MKVGDFLSSGLLARRQLNKFGQSGMLLALSDVFSILDREALLSEHRLGVGRETVG